MTAFNVNKETIGKLQNRAFLQFALPKRGCGFVTLDGNLVIERGSSIKNCGYFTYQQDDDDNCLLYSFVYKEKVGEKEEAEVIEPEDDLMSKDLFAFAAKLGYFFDAQPDKDDYEQLVIQQIDDVTYPLTRIKLTPFKQGLN